MRLTRQEQETVINFDNSSQTASIYTASPQLVRRLEALAETKKAKRSAQGVGE